LFPGTVGARPAGARAAVIASAEGPHPSITGIFKCLQDGLKPAGRAPPHDHCNPWQTVLAAPNKYLALSNKSCTGGEATKKRDSSVSLQAKRDDKRRASGRPDLPSGDVGLHSRRGRLRRDRVTP